MHSQNICQTAYGAAADQMSVTVINRLQAVEIQQQNRERTSGAARALHFRLHHIDQSAVVGQAGKRVGDGKVTNLVKKSRVIKQRSTQYQRVAADLQNLRQREGRVKQTLGLARGQVTRDIQPNGCQKRDVHG